MTRSLSIGKPRRLSAVAAAILTSAFLAQPSFGAAPSSPTPDAFDRACAGDMGLTRDSLDYQACIASLRRVSADLQQQHSLQQARASCAAAGLTAGSRDFAQCTLSNLPYRIGRVDIEGR